VSKRLRRTKPKHRSRTIERSSRSAVSRREYAELVVRLGSVELQAQRNRAELELHAQRIAQLQELVDALKAAAVSPALASEIPPLPIPPMPTVES
jgi:hypothetical protein